MSYLVIFVHEPHFAHCDVRTCHGSLVHHCDRGSEERRERKGEIGKRGKETGMEKVRKGGTH